ncbi:hypothetical protein C8Q70DRAFT_413698 [Cubamyces menziesii]|nr:hypothetical protein C8Q70DRAFT_413698 [Cubamyces menziesii]
MEYLSISNNRAQSHDLCSLPPIHTLLTSLSPILLYQPHTMNGYNGYNGYNGANGLNGLVPQGGPVLNFAPHQRGPPAPVQVPTQARPSARSIEVNFPKPGGKRLYVTDVLGTHSMVLRAQMDDFPNWKDFENEYSPGIWLVINWPGYDTYKERIEIGGQRGVKRFERLLMAVAGVYHDFVLHVKERRLVCRQPGWSITATTKYDLRNLELVSLISHDGGPTFEAKVLVHARPRMM